MSSILTEIMCHGCEKKIQYYQKRIVREGRIGNLSYITEDAQRVFLEPIDLKDEALLEKILKNDFTFYNYIPKFGKFEIEKFIADELRAVILITHDLSPLFNTHILCENTYVSPERIKEALMCILSKTSNDKKETYKLNI